jgi:hypothetical protein
MGAFQGLPVFKPLPAVFRNITGAAVPIDVPFADKAGRKQFLTYRF